MHVLLAVDRHHAARTARLRQEAVEAIEGAHIEDAHPGERLGDRGQPVPVVTGPTRRVEVVPTVQRESVEPKRHALERTPSLGRIGVDHDLVGDLAFGGPWNPCCSLLTHHDRGKREPQRSSPSEGLALYYRLR